MPFGSWSGGANWSFYSLHTKVVCIAYVAGDESTLNKTIYVAFKILKLKLTKIGLYVSGDESTLNKTTYVVCQSF